MSRSRIARPLLLAFPASYQPSLASMPSCYGRLRALRISMRAACSLQRFPKLNFWERH